MWLQPSKRDQRLASLRSDALVSGFRIGSIKVPDLSEHGRVNKKNEIVTVYQKSLQLDEDQKQRFTVVRTTGESGAYLPDGWAWYLRTEMEEADCQRVANCLEGVPSAVSVLSLDADTVGLSWDERSENVTFEKIAQWLTNTAEEYNRTII